MNRRQSGLIARSDINSVEQHGGKSALNCVNITKEHSTEDRAKYTSIALSSIESCFISELISSLILAAADIPGLTLL